MAVSKRNDESGWWFDSRSISDGGADRARPYIAAERPIGKGIEVFSGDVRADKLVHRFRNCLVGNAMSTRTRQTG